MENNRSYLLCPLAVSSGILAGDSPVDEGGVEDEAVAAADPDKLTDALDLLRKKNIHWCLDITVLLIGKAKRTENQA